MNEYDSIALEVLNHEISRLRSLTQRQDRRINTLWRRLDVLGEKAYKLAVLGEKAYKLVDESRLKALANGDKDSSFDQDWYGKFLKSEEGKTHDILSRRAGEMADELEDLESDYCVNCNVLIAFNCLLFEIERHLSEENITPEDREYNSEYDIPDEFFALEEA